MKLLKESFLSILLGLLMLTGSGCAEPGRSGKGTALDRGTESAGNPLPAMDQQTGAANDLEPLLPRGLRITPPPATVPPTSPSPPGVTPPPSPSSPPSERGAINPRTGEYYPSVPGGVINPKSGEILPKVNGGYINPQTGEFIPAPK
jgi:hypothetical protein